MAEMASHIGYQRPMDDPEDTIIDSQQLLALSWVLGRNGKVGFAYYALGSNRVRRRRN
jgi:hypothetical protein